MKYQYARKVFSMQVKGPCSQHGRVHTTIGLLALSFFAGGGGWGERPLSDKRENSGTKHELVGTVKYAYEFKEGVYFRGLFNFCDVS